MKRIAFETRLYDYNTYEEAKKHIDFMRSKGWDAVAQYSVSLDYYGRCIYENGNEELPYSVEYSR